MKEYKTLPGYRFCHDILSANHVLISGCTGSGKSVLLSDILWTLTGYDPHDDRIILIDLKQVELIDFKDFPHTIRYVDKAEQVIPLLDCLIDLMNARFSTMKQKRQKKSSEYRIFVVIDEFAQILSIKGTESRIVKLLQLSRAAGIHLILATQNASRKGIPAGIQQNIVYRIGLACVSAIESKQIIYTTGCEKLPNYGYAYIRNERQLDLIQIPMVTQEKIDERLEFWKHHKTIID